MLRTHKLFFLLFLSLYVASAMASNAGPARSELERFTNELSTFEADFTQTVISQDGRIHDQSQGQVWLNTPNKLRWVYTGDFPEVIVADGANIWIYDESLDQVTVKPQSDDAADSPLMLLADVSQLEEQFNVTEVGDFEDMFLLELKSKNTESEFERILLGMDSTGIRMMAMEDAFGQRTEIKFANTTRNAVVDPELFTFDPPESADLVGVAVIPD